MISKIEQDLLQHLTINHIDAPYPSFKYGNVRYDCTTKFFRTVADINKKLKNETVAIYALQYTYAESPNIMIRYATIKAESEIIIHSRKIINAIMETQCE